MDQVGCIDPFCNVVHVIEDAAANARFLCDRYYLASPELDITQVNGECQVRSGQIARPPPSWASPRSTVSAGSGQIAWPPPSWTSPRSTVSAGSGQVSGELRVKSGQ